MSGEIDALRVLGGILLFMFGLCCLLVGGLCSYLLLEDIQAALSGGGAFAVITLATLALGIFAVVKGVRIIGGRG